MAYDPGTLYYDPILTGFSIGYAPQTFYGERLAPPTRVSQQSGRYRTFDRSNWLIHDSRREPNTVANEIGGRKWSEDTFKTVQHSLQSRIADEEYDNLFGQGGLADPTFGGDITIDPKRDATEDVTQSLQLEQELKVSSEFRNTANYPAGHTVTLTSGAGTQWSDYTGGVSSTSDPVSDLRTAVQKIYLATRRFPNTMIIPFDAVGVIENHPRVIARFQNFNLQIENAWKVLIGIPQALDLNVFVVDSVYNAADNVTLDEDIQSFWGTDVWLGIVDPQEGQRTKTFAKTFYFPFNQGGLRTVDSWREQDKKGDVVRCSTRYDVKVVSGSAGYLFKTAVATVS